MAKELVARGRQVTREFTSSVGFGTYRFCPDTYILDVLMSDGQQLQADAMTDFGLVDRLYNELNYGDERSLREADALVAELVERDLR